MSRGGSWQSSPLLIILLPIVTLTLLFLTVPPLLSATSHILRPTAVVKNSWDSLNILLVVFAILVGVFAPRNDDESPQPRQEGTTINDAVPRNNVTYHTTSSGEQEAGSYVSQQWFGFSEERKVYDAPPIRFQSPATGVTRLRRSSSSYPDLRNWETGDDRYKFRFFDDFEIDKFRSTPLRDQATAVVDRLKRWPEAQDFEEGRIKEIPVDTFEISSSSPNPPPPKSHAPPPPPPPPPHRRKPRRMHQKVDSGREITEHDDDNENEITRIRTPQPAPPPPPSPSVKTRSEHKRRKSNVKREIATVWASVLSNQRKRKKKQRTKITHNHYYDNVDELTN